MPTTRSRDKSSRCQAACLKSPRTQAPLSAKSPVPADKVSAPEADAPAGAGTIFKSGFRPRRVARRAVPGLGLALSLLAVFFLAANLQAASQAAAQRLIARANSLYFQGRYQDAIADYAQAAKLNPISAEPWLDGGVIFTQIQEPQKARDWFSRAAAVDPSSDVLTALGWSQFETRHPAAAQEDFELALEKNSNLAYAWLGLSRLDMAGSRLGQALRDLDNAQKSSPFLNLVPYYRAQTYENLDEDQPAAKALRQSIAADTYFQEARQALARVYLLQHRYNLAGREIIDILNVEPHDRFLLGLLRRLQPLLTTRPAATAASSETKPPTPAPLFPESPRMPLIRVGIGTDQLGKPRLRRILMFSVESGFVLKDAQTKTTLLEDDSGLSWTIMLRQVRGRWRLGILSPRGRMVLLRLGPIVIKPLASSGLIVLNENISSDANLSSKALRGSLEISNFHGTLNPVNIVDVESYVAGVLAAEMPIDSPIEALKAQAIMARTEALALKKIFRPHRRMGYDLCDSQHCQVYEGVLAESSRARAVVAATRGQVVFYKGRLAQVTYSANCGGCTQSSKDVSGWGNIPYWKGVCDTLDDAPAPNSPWSLRQWLMSWPRTYGSPSIYVNPSHFRWTRVVPFDEVGNKLDARFHIGRLKKLVVLRRAASGNVNAVLAVGTRKSARIHSELDIRDLLALGSLRSTLFITETDYDAQGNPRDLIFHGGGWGHGVGLCQSGAIGRALAGQNARRIIESYFPGVSVRALEY